MKVLSIHVHINEMPLFDLSKMILRMRMGMHVDWDAMRPRQILHVVVSKKTMKRSRNFQMISMISMILNLEFRIRRKADPSCICLHLSTRRTMLRGNQPNDPARTLLPAISPLSSPAVRVTRSPLFMSRGFLMLESPMAPGST